MREGLIWTIAEVGQEIAQLLPTGWGITYNLDDQRYYVGAIVDVEGVEQWSTHHVDERLFLLDAYGWLLTRANTARHPTWERRKDTNLSSVSGKLGPHGSASEPEDLDPEQIEKLLTDLAVYEPND